MLFGPSTNAELYPTKRKIVGTDDRFTRTMISAFELTGMVATSTMFEPPETDI